MITLIVPIYNEWPFLPRCIDSIKNQTIPFDEVILIDDCSTDGSLQMAQQYARENGWHFIANTENKGLGGTRNVGVEHATGDYIAFLDSDDALTTSAHEVMLNAIERHPEAEIIQFDHARIVHGLDAPRHNEERFYDIKNGIAELPFFWFYAWNKVYKREAIKDRKFNTLRFGEDEAFNIELLLDGAKIQCVEEKTVLKHFDNANSLTHIKTMRELKEQDAYLVSLLDKYKEPWQQKAITELFTEHRNSTTYKKMGWK